MPRDDRDDIAYLRDMLEACQEVIEFSANRTWQEYQADKMLRRSIERSIEIIGEAARRVSAPCQQANSHIP